MAGGSALGTREGAAPSRAGILHKWTNYAFGWQERYFEIRGGTLLYFRSKSDRIYGCRGSIGLKCATVTVSEMDECRFEVSANDTTWHLRAASGAERQAWLTAINSEPQTDSDYSSVSTAGHSRNASLSSLPGGRQNGNIEVHQPGSTRRAEESLSNANVVKDDVDARVEELCVYRDLCGEQMAQIQNALEELLNNNRGGLSRPQVLALKATHLALSNNIQHIIDILSSKNSEGPGTDSRTALEIERRVSEAYASHSREQHHQLRPQSPTSEEEFYDTRSMVASEPDESTITEEVATETDVVSSSSTLVETKEALSDTRTANSIYPPHRSTKYGDFTRIHLQPGQYCANEIERLTNEQLKYAWAGVEDAVWSLFAEDGEMKMYKREVDIDGLPCDPLKAVHAVDGVSALEYIHHFFAPEYKSHWDQTLEKMRVVEQVAPDTVVLHQIHKTVWPTAQRESLFWSHIRRIPPRSEKFRDAYIVCNKDITRDDVPLSHPSCVRVGLTVSMVCETRIKKSARGKPDAELTRNDIRCSILYVSQVHPGGWVPTAALRVVYKREYPKFLKTFTEFVVERVKNTPLEL